MADNKKVLIDGVYMTPLQVALSGKSDKEIPQKPAAGKSDKTNPQKSATGKSDKVYPQKPATGKSDKTNPQKPASGKKDANTPKIPKPTQKPTPKIPKPTQKPTPKPKEGVSETATDKSRLAPKMTAFQRQRAKQLEGEGYAGRSMTRAQSKKKASEKSSGGFGLKNLFGASKKTAAPNSKKPLSSPFAKKNLAANQKAGKKVY